MTAVPGQEAGVLRIPEASEKVIAPEIDREEELYWLAMILVPGVGARTWNQLLERFGAPGALFRASPSELEAAGLSRAAAQSVAGGCTFEQAATQQQKMLAVGARLVVLNDPAYPPRLRSIFDPPPVLFARGRIELLDSVIVSVVGTRRPTAYGTAAAARLSYDLAAAGLTVASGMARGIDTAAHQAALEAGGNTVAVFGCGVDQVYPAENRQLAERIAEKGLLVSEFPMSTPAYPQNFPVRNRIVSGISAGVLVVEGARYSGSTITARLAVEQGRELFAVPGNITSKMSWTPNLLIKQGAKLVQQAEDVLAELPLADRLRLKRAEKAPPQRQTLEPEIESPVARAVLKRLRVDQPAPIDVLLEQLPQFSSSELIAALFELELLGLVRQLAGKNFVKVW